MMAYLSHLVECGEMDSIFMFFLMVGHTHASIDQYFSVLSHAINKTEFIGTVTTLARYPINQYLLVRCKPFRYSKGSSIFSRACSL